MKNIRICGVPVPIEAVREFVDVTVTVLEIRGDKVRLGIEAPRDVPVHRREVWLLRKALAAADRGNVGEGNAA